MFKDLIKHVVIMNKETNYKEEANAATKSKHSNTATNTPDGIMSISNRSE